MGRYRTNIVFIIFIIGLVVDIFILNISRNWQNTIQWYIRLIIFIPLFLISGSLAQNGLKKVFKEERKELEVIKTSVFGIVRHPIYLGSIIIYLSFIILSLSLLALIIWFFIILFYYYLCRYEEKLLKEKLGEKYIEYMKNVPMLFPKIKRNRSLK